MMTRAHKAGWVAICGFGLAAAGCDIELGESTLGDLGEVEFSYTSGCFFGCSLDRPLLPGTVGRISVSDAGDAAGVLASCAESGIATASVVRSCVCERGGDGWAEGAPVEPDEACEQGFDKRCDNVIELAAHAPGDATLELHQPSDGELIDRVTVLVRQPNSAWLENDGVSLPAGSPLLLRVGQSDGVRVLMEDRDGRQLLVTGGVTWTISDPQIAGFPQWLGDPAHELVTDHIVSIEGLAAGDAAISIRAGDFELASPLRVVP